jgi:bacterial/archaeal transporter family-2 protein
VPSRDRLSFAGYMLGAFSVGGMVAVQAHINGLLAHRLGAGLPGAAVGALLSFGSGFVLLCVLIAVSPPMRQGLRRIAGAVRRGRLRPWHLVGGAGGAMLATAQGITVATIGVALFTVALVAGQTTSAMLVDRIGIGPAGRHPVTANRAFGAALAVAAVALAVSERLGVDTGIASVALLLAAVPLLAGAATAWQQAVNGQVSVVGGPLAAAAVNFVAATVILLVFALTTVALWGLPSPPPTEWWLYLGGAIGVVFIAAAAALVRWLGILLFGLCAIAGQILTSLAVDLVLTDIHIGTLTVAGAVLTLVGVAVAVVPTWVSKTTAGAAAEERDRAGSSPLQ